ncbi:hypothetical protein NITLEN_40056 [Nitrospira lenta]|uniref:Uncharacterized protein n=1 Tax=Nitrospira lenta TaxID=1436998 RepID=A0A330L6V7_9BACT|nr:hypothetical protein NITLEN_40056 [Nitrospira lenta]
MWLDWNGADARWADPVIDCERRSKGNRKPLATQATRFFYNRTSGFYLPMRLMACGRKEFDGVRGRRAAGSVGIVGGCVLSLRESDCPSEAAAVSSSSARGAEASPPFGQVWLSA